MKLSNSFRSMLWNIFFAALSLALIPAQSDAQRGYDPNTPQLTEATIAKRQLNVAIMKVHSTRGSVTLQVFDPAGRDAFLYFKKVYSVQWFRNGQPIGSGPVLTTLNNGNITAIVVDLKNGHKGTASILLGVYKKPPRFLTPYNTPSEQN